MKGFIEIPLLLIFSLLGPILADLNDDLRIKLNLLAKSNATSQELAQAESDLNYFILNDKNFEYKAQHVPIETQHQGEDFTLRTLSVENKATKIIAQSNKQRLFNWSKAFRELEVSKSCTHNLLELNDSKLFDCPKLTIGQLVANSTALLANTGEIYIELIQIQGSNLRVEVIAYQDLKLAEISTPMGNSLLIFSQIGEVLIEKTPPKCSELGWEISSKNKKEQCFPLIKTSDYWPTVRIISTNCHDRNY